MTPLPPYQPPFILLNGHLETIYPALLRKVPLSYQRERIYTPDHDFLDLDWLVNNPQSPSLVIISHGLEGNTHRAYIQGMARAFHQKKYDVLTWNYRGCSEEMNRQLRFYHSGATDDLDTVVQHALTKGYREIFLTGFSMGGNLTLKYLGETKRPREIKRAVVFSVPLHLSSSCKKISSRSNFLYAKRFLTSLRKKIEIKATFRSDLDLQPLSKIKTLLDFDNHYTAPLHGFKHAEEYYEHCSSLYFAPRIQIPTLIVNALNDPFLSPECFPVAEFKNQAHVIFENPARGGHVGFAQFSQNGLYWSEQRALAFIQQHDRTV
jgi:hypothetical protein